MDDLHFRLQEADSLHQTGTAHALRPRGDRPLDPVQEQEGFGHLPAQRCRVNLTKHGRRIDLSYSFAGSRIHRSWPDKETLHREPEALFSFRAHPMRPAATIEPAASSPSPSTPDTRP